MSKPARERVRLRAMLTETLPYEVPVIFSNDRLFKFATASDLDTELVSARKKLLLDHPRYTTPYSFTIRKSLQASTRLGIIHPLMQVRVAEFYDRHSASILAHCNRSDLSIRRPLKIPAQFASEALDHAEDLSEKTGHVQDASSTAPDNLARFVSYFAYGRYTLLAKFIESKEYLSLEMRFPWLRTMDVSKCFFNLYTHSITWAVKGKVFSKKHVNHYSFESAFDKLMQHINYNETNGIVVGPEVSRIFAEIILQYVDRAIVVELAPMGLVGETNYAIRRYIDDYYVFALHEEDLNAIEKVVRSKLEEFKLFLNDRKLSTTRRPFVSSISIARRELGVVLDRVDEMLELKDANSASTLVGKARQVIKSIGDLRLIVSKHDIDFHNVSGWLLGWIRKLVRRTCGLFRPALPPEISSAVGEVVGSLINVAFYICALDPRVRSTYSVCQIISVIKKTRSVMPSDVYDQLTGIAYQQLLRLVRGVVDLGDSRGAQSADSVELFNLLICGAYYIGEDFVKVPYIQERLTALWEREDTGASKDDMTYFAYVTAKFCYLRNPVLFGDKLSKLNKMAASILIDRAVDFLVDTQICLLMHDYVSAPDVSDAEKVAVFDKVFGGQTSKATMRKLTSHIGFVDWTGFKISHLLRRRELRPVYSWS